MRKQLADLRSARSNSRRGGVMRVPAILGVDEWEALASVQQDKLIEDSHEDRADRGERLVVNVESKDEAAFRVHRESEVLYQQERREQSQAIRDYLNAQRKA
jgi:hypothetical protein